MNPRAPLLLACAMGAMGFPGGATAQCPEAFRVADSIVQAGIADGTYPAAVLVVGRRDTILHHRGYGHFTWDPTSPVPDWQETRWDVASLTKVVATAPTILRLAARELVDIDAPVSRYLPSFGGRGRDAITVRHLLTHTSGLQAGLPLARLANTRDEAIAFVLADMPRNPPGTVVRYSDLNAILLGLVVEAVTGESLALAAEREVFRPLGMARTGFVVPDSLHRTAPPAGVEDGVLLQGVPQDPSVRRLGGAAGHAGLFSTGADLARYAQVWLAHGEPTTELISNAWMSYSMMRDTLEGGRYLGWDGPVRMTNTTSSFGAFTTDATYGHTGWTGTQLWVDPVRDLFVVFLTNRSFASGRRGSLGRIRDIRGAVSDAVVRAAGPCTPAGFALSC